MHCAIIKFIPAKTKIFNFNSSGTNKSYKIRVHTHGFFQKANKASQLIKRPFNFLKIRPDFFSQFTFHFNEKKDKC